MNKKGFTLVELLAVIVLLGLVLVITMTNGFGIFNKAKSGINQIEENNLIEAAKVFLVEVDNGFVNHPTSCNVFEKKYSNGNIVSSGNCTIDVSYIIENYMDKTPENCNKENNKVFKIKIQKIYNDTTGEDLKETNYIVEKTSETDIICSN